MQKTRKAVAKRFKITANAKVLAPRAGKRHLLQTKSAKRRRRLRGLAVIRKADARRVIESLPFAHR